MSPFRFQFVTVGTLLTQIICRVSSLKSCGNDSDYIGTTIALDPACKTAWDSMKEHISSFTSQSAVDFCSSTSCSRKYQTYLSALDKDADCQYTMWKSLYRFGFDSRLNQSCFDLAYSSFHQFFDYFNGPRLYQIVRSGIQPLNLTKLNSNQCGNSTWCAIIPYITEARNAVDDEYMNYVINRMGEAVHECGISVANLSACFTTIEPLTSSAAPKIEVIKESNTLTIVWISSLGLVMLVVYFSIIYHRQSSTSSYVPLNSEDGDSNSSEYENETWKRDLNFIRECLREEYRFLFDALSGSFDTSNSKTKKDVNSLNDICALAILNGLWKLSTSLLSTPEHVKFLIRESVWMDEIILCFRKKDSKSEYIFLMERAIDEDQMHNLLVSFHARSYLLESIISLSGNFQQISREVGSEIQFLSAFEPEGTLPVSTEQVAPDFGHVLGRGQQSVVYHGIVQSSRDMPVAIKIFAPEEEHKWNIEYLLCSNFKNPNVVRTIHAGRSHFGFFIVYEYCDRSLENVGLMDNEKDCLLYLHDIAKGMLAVHNANTVHRDLKPSNVFLSNSRSFGDGDEDDAKESRLIAKVGDFGHAINISLNESISSTDQFFGTPIYLAPEYILDPTLKGHASGDVYSFGMIIYFLLYGKEGFAECKSTQELYNRVRQGDRPEILVSGQPFLVELMEECWSQSPSNRPTFQNIVTRLCLKVHEIGHDDGLSEFCAEDLCHH